jgi:hypothetical protein
MFTNQFAGAARLTAAEWGAVEKLRRARAGERRPRPYALTR